VPRGTGFSWTGGVVFAGDTGRAISKVAAPTGAGDQDIDASTQRVPSGAAPYGADGGNVVLRVREGGEVLDRIEVDRPCYACMLGGEDGRTLFMVVAQWFGPDRMDELIEAKTGQILTAQVAVPHAGWP
jgi:hypothetical protein